MMVQGFFLDASDRQDVAPQLRSAPVVAYTEHGPADFRLPWPQHHAGCVDDQIDRGNWLPVHGNP